MATFSGQQLNHVYFQTEILYLETSSKQYRRVRTDHSIKIFAQFLDIVRNLKWHFSFHSVRRKMPSVNLNHGRQLNSDTNMQTWVRQKLIHLSSSWLQNSDLEVLIEIGRYSRVCAVLVGLTTPVQYCNKLPSTWLDVRCRTKPCKIKLKRWFRVPISMKF